MCSPVAGAGGDLVSLFNRYSLPSRVEGASMPALNTATSSRPIGRRASDKVSARGARASSATGPASASAWPSQTRASSDNRVGGRAAVGHGPFGAALFAARWLCMAFDAARTVPGARRVECARWRPA